MNEMPIPDDLKETDDFRLPDLPKPLTTSKHWDKCLDWNLAGERAARMEREDQLRESKQRIARLEADLRQTETDKAELQGKFTGLLTTATRLEAENAELRKTTEYFQGSVCDECLSTIVGLHSQLATAREALKDSLSAFAWLPKDEAPIRKRTGEVCIKLRAALAATDDLDTTNGGSK